VQDSSRQRGQHAVTGAFGYLGKYIASRLVKDGYPVITLTHSADRPNPFGDAVKVVPFDFDRPDLLRRNLAGVSTLYNTYWIRHESRKMTFAKAVDNLAVLFEACKQAGVRRVVHISITHADSQSSSPYFRGKAEVERRLKETGLSYAILRPPLLFGKEDVLINNIAWALRRLPVFGMFGKGQFRLQPVYVDDVARAAVEQGLSRQDITLNTVGPETYTYRQLLGMISHAMGLHRVFVPMPAGVVQGVGRVLGWMLGDVLFTPDEVESLMREFLYVHNDGVIGTTRLSRWVAQYAPHLGRRYSNETARHKDRSRPYQKVEQ
jgi:uncharacterized protein YbjT (DUF2867 family)